MAAPALVDKHPILQVIDEKTAFRASLKQDLMDWGFHAKGTDYMVVSVLGAQSTGKSTLLNKLFGMEFAVMDAAKGRRQTTQGIWLGLSGTTEQNILVFDVEGTDSRERGEDHGQLERKLSLFSLAMSDLLIVNLWEKDVGRYEAANLSLLKIVFETNLKLFRGARTNKTLILVVFRDHDPITPLERLAETVGNDMEKIWTSMPKTATSADARMSDYFDFSYTSLPHKNFAKEQFETDVVALRERFLDPNHPKFLLKTTYKTAVPADGFSHYASKIWEAILSEKDLNLPSQKQMLAIFRCEEIAKEVYAAFEKKVEAQLSEPLSRGEMVKNFGSVAAEAAKAALTTYNSASERYDATIKVQKGDDLNQRLDGALQNLFHQQLKLALTLVKTNFVAAFRKAVPGQEPLKNFLSLAAAVRAASVAELASLIKESQVENYTWTTKAEEDDLVAFIEQKVAEEKAAQLKLFAEQFKKQLEKDLSQRISKAFDSPSESMWEPIRKNFSVASDKSNAEFRAVLSEFQCSKEETETILSAQDRLSFAALRAIVEDRAKNLDVLMNRKFKEVFELDAHGIPRQWMPKDDVAGLWVEGKMEAEKLVDLFAVIRLAKLEKVHLYRVNEAKKCVEAIEDAHDVPSDYLVISTSEGQRLLDRFRDYATGPYQAAMKEQERAKATGSIPAYFWILLLGLGFNELMSFLHAVIYNPFLLIFALFVLGAVVAIWKLNLWPLIAQLLSPVLSQADLMLREKISELIHGQHGQPQAQAPNTPAAQKKKQD